MKTEIIQVEERGFTERFLLSNNKGHLKGFQTNLKHGKIPPALGTDQIAGYVPPAHVLRKKK